MTDERIQAVSDLCDRFSEHFIDHDWASVIAALALSLRTAFDCVAKREGVALDAETKALCDDLARLTDDMLALPARES